jgi:putative ABC transport system permease protein
VHTFKSFGDMLPRMLMDVATKPSSAVASSLSLSLMTREADVDQTLKTKGELRWQSQKTIRDVALETFDRTFTITSILIFIAVMVAGIGIYVATTVLRLNQQASTRLLYGMGISRAEVWGVDLARGFGIGVIACLLALPLGCAIGWILCNIVNPRAFGWTVTLLLDLNSIAIPVAWGMIAAVLATLIRVGQQEQGRMDAVAR